MCTVERSPDTSTRRVVYVATVVRVLHQLLCPLHVQQVQALEPAPNYERRNAFCEWLLQGDATSQAFLCYVDGCSMLHTELYNISSISNQHTWAAENRVIRSRNHFQKQFPVSVLTGIVHALPPRISGASSLQLLSEEFPNVF